MTLECGLDGQFSWSARCYIGITPGQQWELTTQQYGAIVVHGADVPVVSALKKKDLVARRQGNKELNEQYYNYKF